MRARDKYTPEVAQVEQNLLVEGVRRIHGIDLGEHEPEALRAALWEAMEREEVRTLSGLQEHLLHGEAALARLVASLRAARERRPARFLTRVRREIVPLLRTYPFIRVWQAGCGSVFETFVLSIIFLEEGVYEKSTIYTTDPDPVLLARTQHGLFPMLQLAECARLYRESGGVAEFDEYCLAGEESASFDWGLRRNMVFAQHDFATDGSLNEFNAIFCRQSLAALKPSTRYRAENLLCDSLVMFGVLSLPQQESLELRLSHRFEKWNQEHNLYRKIA